MEYNLGNCSEKIRFKYSINNDKEIIYQVFEMIFEGERIVNYSAYKIDDLEKPLDLSECNNSIIFIDINEKHDIWKIFENIEELENWFEIFKNAKDVFDISSPLYNDHCYPLSDYENYDIIMQDRREYIEKKKIPICPDECECDGFNIKEMQALCYCPDKLNLNNNTSGIKKFSYLNFKVLYCYEIIDFTVFFPEIFFAFFIINIILIRMTGKNLEQNFDLLTKYCLEFIGKNNDNNSTFKILKELYLSDKNNENINRENWNENIQKKIMKNPQNEDEKVFLDDNNKEEIIYYINLEWDNKEKYDYYYLILIKSYQKNERKNYLIEEELNDLDYDYYINIEDRNWFLIFWSLFKNNYDLINILLISNNQKKGEFRQYKLYPLKIMVYINSIIITFIIIILFYYDEKMHSIYKEEGKYNFLYNSPQIIAQDIVMKVFSTFFEWLIDLQDQFIEIKNNLKKEKNDNENNSNNENGIDRFNDEIIMEINKNKKNFKIYFVIFRIIIILINMFAFYYASCFFTIYKSTQIHILKDFLNGQLTSLIFCLFSCLIYSIIKKILSKCRYGKHKKRLFYILKKIPIFFAIEILLEILVTIFYIL